MATFDSDTSRGFYQHRRSEIPGQNGDGAPLVTDILPGEIAINLETRKLYTKRNTYTTTQTAATVNGDMVKVGQQIVLFRAYNDSDFSFDIGVDGTTFSIDVLATDTVSAIATKISDAVTGVADVLDSANANKVNIYKTTAASTTFDFTDMFANFEFGLNPIIRVPTTDFSTAFNSADANTVVTFDYEVGTFRRANAQGTWISNGAGSTSIFITNFNGDHEIGRTGFKLARKDRNDSEEIIELNNVPHVRPDLPKDTLNDGNFWLQNRADASGGLYWLDTSITDDTSIQTTIRAGVVDSDSDYLVERNLVLYAGDSDRAPDAIFAEWRLINSPSLLPDQSTVISGDVFYQDQETTFTGSGINLVRSELYLDTESSLIIDGDATFRSGSTLALDSDSTISLFGRNFDEITNLQITDEGGTVQFSLWGFAD